MELLVCVVDRDQHLERILSAFVDLGIRGATIVNSEGMAHHVGDELPVLTGLQALLERTRPHSATVFSVIDDAATIETAIETISEICGGLEGPGTGIVFTVPVQRVHGLMRSSDAGP
jgi:nitrogen regulatory protein PII